MHQFALHIAYHICLHFFLYIFLTAPTTLSTYLRLSSHFQTKASATTIQFSPQYCKYWLIKVINSPRTEPKSNPKPFLTLLIPPPVTISTTKYIWPLLSGKCPRPGRWLTSRASSAGCQCHKTGPMSSLPAFVWGSQWPGQGNRWTMFTRIY